MRLSVVLLLLLGTFACPSEADYGPSSIRVAYVTESTVYLDAGSAAGIKQSDRFEIVRGELVIARLEATFLSSRTTACSFVDRSDWPEPGDLHP